MQIYKVEGALDADANGRLVTIVREQPGSHYVFIKHYQSNKHWWVRRESLRPYCQEWQYHFMREYPSYGFEEVMRVSNSVFKTITPPGGLKPVDLTLASPMFQRILNDMRRAEGRPLPDEIVFIGGPKHGDVEQHRNRHSLHTYQLTHSWMYRSMFALDFGAGTPSQDVTASILTYQRMKDGRAVLQQVMDLYPADVIAGHHFKG